MTEMATIRVRSRTLGIHAATGAVMDARKWAVTEVSGGGGGGQVHGANGSVHGASFTESISSKTTNHAELFIRGMDGKEHVVKLENEDVNVRTGSWVSLLWAIPAGEHSGPYFAVMNHDTGRFEFIKSGVSAACSSTAVVVAAIVAFIVMVLGFLILFTVHTLAAWLLIAAFPVFLFWHSRVRRKFMRDACALRARIDGSRPAATQTA